MSMKYYIAAVTKKTGNWNHYQRAIRLIDRYHWINLEAGSYFFFSKYFWLGSVSWTKPDGVYFGTCVSSFSPGFVRFLRIIILPKRRTERCWKHFESLILSEIGNKLRCLVKFFKRNSVGNIKDTIQNVQSIQTQHLVMLICLSRIHPTSTCL